MRENRVRDVTAKEPRRRQEGGERKTEREIDRRGEGGAQEISGNSLEGGKGWRSDSGNPSQRLKTGSLCSTKETHASGGLKRKRSFDPTTRSYTLL